MLKSIFSFTAFIIRVALLCCCLLTPVWADEEPVLKESIIVQGEIVTLGDLFENTGPYKNIPVFRSPDFGSDGVISASRVQAAAAREGLIWNNPGRVDKLIVRRPSRTITLNNIKDLLRPQLSEKTGINNNEDLTITFATGTKDIHIDKQIVADLVVMSLAYNPQNKAFKAQIGTEESTGNISRGIITGRVDQTSLVVFPTNSLEPGIAITENDLKTMRVSVERLRAGYISDTRLAVGKTPKYRLGPNQVLRSQDLEVPKIVKTNDLVEIRYQVPGLYLKSQGRALGSGAKGDIISVLNTRSKRKIQVTIQAPGVVFPADTPARIVGSSGS
ncbi:MAG: flagellar basal body P-ring formation chaperone FlgA [Methyloligellaceae bacterium]